MRIRGLWGGMRRILLVQVIKRYSTTDYCPLAIIVLVHLLQEVRERLGIRFEGE